MDIIQALTMASNARASDVVIMAGSQPMMRLNGVIMPIPGTAPLGSDEAKGFVYSAMAEYQKQKFEQDWELDYSFAIPGVARFRVNVLVQKTGVAAVYRVVPSKIPAPHEIDLSPEMLAVTDYPRGLVLVTGPTGSGKSTTLATLMDAINRKYNKTILTIEDPIEFVFENKNSIVLQREIGPHTKSFANALKHALRQSPDVIFVGEMRDLETMQMVVSAAETGHLCFATLHTQDAPSTIDRIVDVFPPQQQQQVREQLSLALQAVITQILLPNKNGLGRVAAREFMVMTPAIANLIRENKAHMIYGAIETGQKWGMFSLDQCLARMVRQNRIRLEDALQKAQDPDNVKKIISLSMPQND